MQVRAALVTAVLVLAAILAEAQAAPSSRPTVRIPRITTEPELGDFIDLPPDGIVRTGLRRITDFVQRTPTDGAPSSERTDVYLGYDQRNLYVVFVCFDSDRAGIRGHMSRRDQIPSDDQIEIMLDTYADERRAYAFVVNPLGVQWDTLWTEGQGFDPSWDTLWYTDGELTDFGYAVKMAIPFKSLRFSATHEQTWGLILLREIQRKNEQTFWPEISSRIEGRLNQAATLTGIEGISPGRNMQVIPYATGRSFRLLDPVAAGGPRFVDDDEATVGVDAKLVFEDSLSLDLTANPDFGQVESDNPRR